MGEYGASTALGSAKATRLDNDIERIASLARRINGTTDRVLRLARTLGYFNDAPPPTDARTAPHPISLTLQDVLSDLERAVDANGASLNIFD